ncbi:MAG: RNA polymerase sigma factor RpoD/SigA [Verrucomicrobia bacterium]|nr:RNA polymerase sigma factor RpoD/SigA [Verrucomicrobiota bacterium]MCH8512764.1 RNA polymerase sigma factor RpoD/SigA [Kiritimatiellia bacterium]
MNENDSTFRAYLRSISQEPLLTREEENVLAERIKVGDQEAIDHMVRANLRLVVKIARNYAGLGVPLMDLIAEGNTGLMKAVERFDPSKGGKMSTYGAWWIKQAIKRALSNQSKTIRLPSHLIEKLTRIRKFVHEFHQDNGREPTNAEIAEYMGVKPGAIAHWKAMSVNPASLDAPIGDDDGGSFSDLISDAASRNGFDVLDEIQVSTSVKGLMDHLDDRELKILNYRYGLDGSDPETLERVGERFSITRERVRQIQKSALEKLKGMFDDFNEPRLNGSTPSAMAT